MPNAIQLKDNETIQVTLKYSNATRKTSQREGGGFYYAFDCEEGRLNANAALLKAILADFPGKGGRMQIKRWNHSAYEVAVIQKGQDYPFEMREWSDESSGFVQIPWDGETGGGTAPESTTAAPQASQPQSNAPAQKTPSQAAQTTGAFWELNLLMHRCFEAVEMIAPEEYTPAERQASAISLFIECNKKGISGTQACQEMDEHTMVSLPDETPVPDENQQPDMSNVPPPSEPPPDPQSTGNDELPF